MTLIQALVRNVGTCRPDVKANDYEEGIEMQSMFDKCEPNFVCGVYCNSETIDLYEIGSDGDGDDDPQYFAVKQFFDVERHNQKSVIEVSATDYEESIKAASEFNYGDVRRVATLDRLFFNSEA